MTKLRCSVFILPHGMAVTGTDCTHMPLWNQVPVSWWVGVPFLSSAWHQKKTCEMITPHGVIRQFPANGRLITPTMSWSHHLSFDHTVKFLITPLNVWSHRHIFDHTLKFLITPYTFCSHRKDFNHTVKNFDHTVKLFDHTVYILFTPFRFYSHHQIFCSHHLFFMITPS